jgi:hypothetical protein
LKQLQVPVAPLDGWYRWRDHDDMGSIEEDTIKDTGEPRPYQRCASEPHVAHHCAEIRQRA